MKAKHANGAKTEIPLTEFIWPLTDETAAAFEAIILREAQRILEFIFNDDDGGGISVSLPFAKTFRPDKSITDPLTLRFTFPDFEVGDGEFSTPSFDVRLAEIVREQIEDALPWRAEELKPPASDLWRQVAESLRELADYIDAKAAKPGR
jgi:hypothetical protein